jgi:hypothetical protein
LGWGFLVAAALFLVFLEADEPWIGGEERRWRLPARTPVFLTILG